MITKLINDDCLVALQGMEAESVDSLVTDPPAGISFMGKEWDDNKGGREHWIKWMTSVMQECMRVMKPGAHGLVWAIPRTSHWTATALEDAGFEVRDVVTHLFGSGFPKSLDISKAIDKTAGAERVVIGSRKADDIRGGNLNHRVCDGDTKTHMIDITAPATDDAKQWSGFGTALKPASEHWILVRKPCSEKTVAKNVLKHGVGGINIDGCRVESTYSETELRKNFTYYRPCEDKAGWMFKGGEGTKPHNLGRFPANLVLSHTIFCTDDECDDTCAVRLLDEQSGILKSGSIESHHVRTTLKTKNSYGERAAPPEVRKGDTGGASRFFYCAKASKSDRNRGCEGNHHPTVKPNKLMRYLIRLITPPGGLVLDPFMGSGSTGVAAKDEGFNFIGIEKQEEYLAIAQARMDAFL